MWSFVVQKKISRLPSDYFGELNQMQLLCSCTFDKEKFGELSMNEMLWDTFFSSAIGTCVTRPLLRWVVLEMDAKVSLDWMYGTGILLSQNERNKSRFIFPFYEHKLDNGIQKRWQLCFTRTEIRLWSKQLAFGLFLTFFFFHFFLTKKIPSIFIC